MGYESTSFGFGEKVKVKAKGSHFDGMTGSIVAKPQKPKTDHLRVLLDEAWPRAMWFGPEELEKL